MDTNRKKKLALNIIVFLTIMTFTIWFVFREEDFGAVRTAMEEMSLGHLLLAVVIALFFVGMEGIMIWYLLRSIDGTSTLASCISCSVIGFVFSGFTPSATGGQPMQLFYLKRD